LLAAGPVVAQVEIDCKDPLLLSRLLCPFCHLTWGDISKGKLHCLGCPGRSMGTFHNPPTYTHTHACPPTYTCSLPLSVFFPTPFPTTRLDVPPTIPLLHPYSFPLEMKGKGGERTDTLGPPFLSSSCLSRQCGELAH
jgi:hypothetical protein